MAPEKPFQFFRAGKLHFFCPLCKRHQSTNTIARVKFQHHLQLALLTVAVTLLAFPIFGLKGLALYLVFWACFEFFYRLRKRQALICESCGFDPFLYKQDAGVARKALRQHWETRIAKENLFANLKLKNYQTARVNETAKNDTPASPSQVQAKSP